MPASKVTFHTFLNASGESVPQQNSDMPMTEFVESKFIIYRLLVECVHLIPVP